MRTGVFVDEIAAVRASVQARDCQAEAGADCCRTGALAARESLEEVRDELRRNSDAAVLDGEPEMPIRLLRSDDHRWDAVAEGVRDEIRHDAVERIPVNGGDRVLRHVDLHVLWLGCGDADDLLDL